MPALNWIGTVNQTAPTRRGIFSLRLVHTVWKAFFGETLLSEHTDKEDARKAAQDYFDHCEHMDPEMSDSGMGWSRAVASLEKSWDSATGSASPLPELNWQPFPNAVPDAKNHVAQFADMPNGRYKIIPPSHNEYPRWIVLHEDEFVGDNKSERTAKERVATHLRDYKDFAAEEDAGLPPHSELSIKQVQAAIDDFRAIPRVIALRREVALFAIQAQQGLIHRLANMRGVPEEFKTPNEKLSLKMEYLWQVNQFLHGRRGLDGGFFTLQNDGFRFTLKWIPMR